MPVATTGLATVLSIATTPGKVFATQINTNPLGMRTAENSGNDGFMLLLGQAGAVKLTKVVKHLAQQAAHSDLIEKRRWNQYYTPPIARGNA